MGGGGETTPLVCCLRCSVGFVGGVSCIVGRVRALFLSLALFLLPLRACVRAAVAGRVPACECGGSSHGHMPGVSVVVVVVVVVDLALLARRRPPGTGTRQGQESTPTQLTARVPPHLPQRGRVAARVATVFSSPSPSLITNTAPPDGPQSRKQTLQQTQTRGASCAIGGARVDLAAVATAFPGQPEVKSCCCCPPPPP